MCWNLSVNLTGQTCPDHATETEESVLTIHLRSQGLEWNKARQALISHHPSSTCCVSSLLLNSLSEMHKSSALLSSGGV